MILSVKHLNLHIYRNDQMLLGGYPTENSADPDQTDITANFHGVRKIRKNTVWHFVFGKTCNEPRHEKTGFLYMQKQRRRSASR